MNIIKADFLVKIRMTDYRTEKCRSADFVAYHGNQGKQNSYI
jgi:hypothetical protein